MERFKKNLGIIGKALESVDGEEFDALKRECLESIAVGRKIITTGLGKNVPICEKFVGTMNSLGIPAAFMHTNSAVHGDLGLVKDGDTVILLTKSGETAESIHLARLMEKRGCKLWLLSFNGRSTLSRVIPKKIIIKLEHEGDIWDILPNNSTVLNLIVLQELGMEIAAELRIGIEELRMNHPGGAIGQRLGVEM